MFAVQYGGIEVPVFSRNEAVKMAGSDSGFPRAEERKARKDERLAELRFRYEKGYPLSFWERMRARWLF